MDLKRVMNLVFWVAISQCFCYCIGYGFSVGGRDGWVVHPSEDYSHWSHRNRFLVNDTLYFKFKKGKDSVLEVTKDDYYNCNTSNWLFKNSNGSSEFKLSRSGPFFFISGVKKHCNNGQKLLLIVLSEKHHIPSLPAASSPAYPPSISLPPSPAPFTSPAPEASPTSVSPAPAVSDVSSPGPSVQSPSSPAVSPPPTGRAADIIPPTPVPVPSEKGAASAIDLALPISIAFMFLGFTV